MSTHTCRACLVFCVDFRFHQQLNGFIAETGLTEEGVDVIRVAGASKNLARPQTDGAREFLMEQLAICKRLHGVREIYLINHVDCGAYGLENVVDTKEELATHVKDLVAARQLLESHFTDTSVFTYFAWFDGRVERID